MVTKRQASLKNKCEGTNLLGAGSPWPVSNGGNVFLIIGSCIIISIIDLWY